MKDKVSRVVKVYDYGLEIKKKKKNDNKKLKNNRNFQIQSFFIERTVQIYFATYSSNCHVCFKLNEFTVEAPGKPIVYNNTRLTTYEILRTGANELSVNSNSQSFLFYDVRESLNDALAVVVRRFE